MIKANDIKAGAVIDVKGTPYIVEKVSKQTPSARGASTLYKIRARNLLNRGKTDLTCRGDDAFQQPDFQTRELQFLYRETDTCVFMDLEDYEQYEIETADLSGEIPFLTENLEGIFGLVLEGRMVGINLPDTVTLELVECDPAIKGASATARTKSAVTETGLDLQVPEYLQQGEKVRVDTKTGKFLSRE